MRSQKPSVLDLFCGAGGMSLGFERAGFEVRLAIDKNPAAISTYRRNFSHQAELIELSDAVDLPMTDVVIGGPPCQGFSSAGARRSTDPRNSLVGVFARIISRLRPRAFVFENVEGFLTGDGGRHVLELLEPLLEVGYNVHLRKVNAANFGVPQHRKRVIALGGLGWDPGFPMPTHAAFGAPGARRFGLDLPKAPTVREALAGLPQVTAADLPNLQGHFVKALEGIALERAQSLRPNETMRDLPAHLQHESYRRRAARRVADGTPTEKRGGAPAGIRRLAADEPSKAITSGARTEFLHPIEHRNLTLRECARLQTFPDEFDFFGTQSEQALLVGNAVPPLLAYQFARHLHSHLSNRKEVKGEGGLLSCSLTGSDGMSPALRKTSDLLLGLVAEKGYNVMQENLNFGDF